MLRGHLSLVLNVLDLVISRERKVFYPSILYAPEVTTASLDEANTFAENISFNSSLDNNFRELADSHPPANRKFENTKQEHDIVKATGSDYVIDMFSIVTFESTW